MIRFLAGIYSSSEPVQHSKGFVGLANTFSDVTNSARKEFSADSAHRVEVQDEQSLPTALEPMLEPSFSCCVLRVRV